MDKCCEVHGLVLDSYSGLCDDCREQGVISLEEHHRLMEKQAEEILGIKNFENKIKEIEDKWNNDYHITNNLLKAIKCNCVWCQATRDINFLIKELKDRL